MSTYTLFNSDFSAGEISPVFLGRSDLERYNKGLELCRNAIPNPLGCVYKRHGTKYLATLPSGTTAALAIFDAGNHGRYVVEFTNLLIRFWTDSGMLVQYNSADFSIVSAYASSELSTIRTTMNKGIMYIVHGNHKPATIRLGSASEAPFVLTPDATTGDRFTDFTFSELDSSGGTVVLSSHAIYLQESDMYGSRIKWLINGQRILAGAGKSIWMSDGSIPTPSTFDMDITLQGGCSSTPPLALDNYIVYADFGGNHVCIMSYSEDSDGYTKSVLSSTAGNMLLDGIKTMALMQGKQSIIWIVTNEGNLVSCTFEPSSGINGWALHQLGGAAAKAETLIVLPGDEDSADSLWIVVNRSGTLTVEKIDAESPEERGFGNYLDSSVTLTFDTPTNTITIPRFAGLSVSAVADDAVLPDKTLDANGSATYDRSFSSITVGFKYTMTLRTVRREIPANGSSQMNRKNIQEATLRLYQSLGGKVGKSLDDMIPILPIVAGSYVFNTAPQLVTGDRKISISSSTDEESRLYITSDDPMPLCLLAVMIRFGIKEA
ncbi:MAG: hypothetical protein ACQGQO_08750 [Sphaerochaetaceae bacterium]